MTNNIRQSSLRTRLACTCSLGAAFFCSTASLAQPFQSYYKQTPGFDPYSVRARDLQLINDRTTGASAYVAANPDGFITRFKPSGNIVGMWRYETLFQDAQGNCLPYPSGGLSVDTLEQTF